jgi:hypothetical protein
MQLGVFTVSQKEEQPMRRTLVLVLIMLVGAMFVNINQASAKRYWHKKAEQQESKSGKKAPTKGKEKPFAVVAKDHIKIEGLFDFYVDTAENSVLMAVGPDQLDKMHLVNITRSAGDGTFYEAGAQAGAFPLVLKRVGKQINFLVLNLNYRADTTAALARALERSISESLFGSAQIASLPDTNGAVLIDPTEVLVMDVPNATHYLGQRSKTGLRFDQKNSYFGEIKSFPENS